MSTQVTSPYLDPVLWRLSARRRVVSVDAGFVGRSLRAALLDALTTDEDGGMARPDAEGGQVLALAVPRDDVIESVGIAIPHSLRLDELAPLRQAIERLRGDTFGGELALGERVVDERLTAEATTWRTLTPYIGEGMARGPSAQRKRVRRSLRYALYPGYRPEAARERVAELVESIEVSDAREWEVSPPEPDAVRIIEHVQITFGREVRGPLVIGRERHAGLGLMVPA